jgi:hypothetical protein
MTRPAAISTRSDSDEATVVQAVTVIMGVIVGLTFLFGFGNVLNLALRLDVPAWVAPLVAPAVDLSTPCPRPRLPIQRHDRRVGCSARSTSWRSSPSTRTHLFEDPGRHDVAGANPRRREDIFPDGAVQRGRVAARALGGF